jgi:uncharacterized protein
MADQPDSRIQSQNESQDQSQDDVLAFLGDPATYARGKDGAAAVPVKRIDTHAATVFLTGERALKIKRAVRFPFLDYSTLEKRKAACEAELAVNRPYAPDIYRGVIAVTREADGRLALSGSGRPIEWAVDMRRFDENRTLDHLAAEIDDGLADELGRAVASGHAKAPVVDAAPWIEALNTYLGQNIAAFRNRPDLFEPEAVAAFDSRMHETYARIRALLAERGRLGCVRRGHGDLHLGNIALIGQRPVLFDAIEFDPLIASGDVLYDLAFLLMDLCERGSGQAATIVLNRYLAETRRIQDLDGLAALPFFVALRASIRAMVTAARIERAAAHQQAAIGKAARGYFAFAQTAISPPRPQLIAVGGLSGTGKTLLSRALASHVPPLPGAVIVRSDVERKALFGAAETDKLPENAYTAEVTERVYSVLLDKAHRILGAGHSAIIDAVFAKPRERDAFAAASQAAGVPLHGLFLTANLATRLARVGGRINDASDADERVAHAQERYDLGSLDWSEVDASGAPQDTLARALKALHA